MNCTFCTAPATAIKYENEVVDVVNDEEVIAKIANPICTACAENYYDGSEDFPGTQPLALAA